MRLQTALLGILFTFCLVGTSGAWAHTTCEKELLNPATAHKWTGKTLILDTNVLLNDPQAIYKYPGANLIISGTVIEELNNKKTDPRLGKTARLFSREIIKLLEKAKGTDQIPLGQGAKLTLDYKNYVEQLAKTTLDRKVKDNEILATAMAYGEKVGAENVAVISDDLNVRIKAFGLKIDARPFELDWGTPVEAKTNSDLLEYELSDEQMKSFLELGFVAKPEGLDIVPNEFVTFKSPGTPPSPKTVGRFRFHRDDPTKLFIYALPNFKELPFQPLNLEQAMALDVLLDPNIDCVFLEAKAGTGKTFLTMMAALEMKQKKIYNRVMVTKPTVYMGHNNPGALPGGIEEKYGEWVKPYLDNLSTLQAAGRRRSNADEAKDKDGKRRGADTHQMVTSLPMGFELLPFEFMRGRSIPYAMIVVDEFQNTNLHEAKTILTRAGENSKMVIMGDPSQIDVSPNFLNATNNGLTVSATLLTDRNLPMDKRSRVARVHLHAGVRSGFADMASEVFNQPIPLD